MRAIAKPTYDPLAVYQQCISSISDPSLRNRLSQVTNSISTAARDYAQKAEAQLLYTIASNACKNHEITLGNVTKEELKSVYSSHMVVQTKPARMVYDSLLSLAPLGKCPFCGIGHATTLDHYLPKTKYPQFSVLPLNLVPACKDCNTGKLVDSATTAEDQILHPYFDHENFIDKQWLYAEVIQTMPATIRFFVSAPDDWDEISRARVRHHFNDFKLASRYSIEASNQLACLRDSLAIYYQTLGDVWVRKNLEIEAETHAKQHVNSWQTAMYQALSGSGWYCQGGFWMA